MARELTREEREQEAEYIKDHWDSASKTIGLLLAGHAAVLAGGLAALKEIVTIPILKGMGLVLELAAIGLVLASVAYGAAHMCRVAKIKRARKTSEPHYMTWLVVYFVGVWSSLLLFLAEIWLAGLRLGAI